MPSVGDVLKKYWGFDSLRPLQGEMVQVGLDGRDALAVMPTGGGKSLCFQIPPLLDGGLTLVVSPLIALMKDQVDALRLIGYPVEALNSSMTSGEQSLAILAVRNGTAKLLYMSPERLFLGSTIELLREANVKRIAIDEAHCISQWGHDFRPEYRQLTRLKEVFPSASIQAFTATATPNVRKDIGRQLGMKQAKLLVGTFDRPNLTYRVEPKSNAVHQIVQAIKRFPDEGSIVYCISRKDTEQMATALTANGVTARAYHAGLAPGERKEISEAFAQERLHVIVATVAFGMGIDRANVRCVIHESMPKSIEAYQQETGRAGRDGLPSECLMLYSGGDIVRWRKVMTASDRSPVELQLLQETQSYATGQTCRHAFLSRYFGQEYAKPEGCEACDLCLDGWQTVEGSTERAHTILQACLSLVGRNPNFLFGAGHLAAVLKGANTNEVRKHGHDQLTGFGALKEVDKGSIGAWINQLIDLGHLARQGDEFPKVVLTERGRTALSANEEIAMREAMVTPTRQRRTAQVEFDYDQGLFEGLRTWRRQLATDRNVPAFVILADRTLMHISAVRPTDLPNLANVSGIGEQKLAEFGAEIVALVGDYVVTKGLASNVQGPSSEVKPVQKSKTTSQVLLESLFERGVSIPELCEKSGLKVSTVSAYLATWIKESKPASIAPWVTPERYALIANELLKSEDGRYKPIFEALNEEVSYEEIRFVKVHLECNG